jgi:hypothetical protein
MAIAGQNPNVVIGFGERIAAQEQGQVPIEFFRVLISDRSRIEDVKNSLLEAMKYFSRLLINVLI